MLWSIINGSLSGTALIAEIAALAFVFLCCLPIHEFAHAWMADRLGDKTPRLAGRLTLNPFAHFDIYGTLLLLLAGVGFAKSVPVNPRNMRCGSKKGLALTSLAGPVSNVLLAFILLIIWNIVNLLTRNNSSENLYLLDSFFYYAASINVSLAIFNILPIPPLDGFNILQVFLPYKATMWVHKYHDYIRYALLAAVFFGLLSAPISFLSGLLYNGLAWLANLPFALAG